MGRTRVKNRPRILELNDPEKGKKAPNSLENSENLSKLIAEIIVENIIKKYRNGRNRICKD